MEQIIAAQGPAPAIATLGHLTRDVRAERAGVVTGIDCFRLGRIARLAGAPIAKGAGIDLFKKVGDRVSQGDPLYRIHANLETDFGFASDMAVDMSGYVIG
jgi:thymidine phosphorylase